MLRAQVSYIARSLSRIAFLILIPDLWNTWMQDKNYCRNSPLANSGLNTPEGVFLQMPLLCFSLTAEGLTILQLLFCMGHLFAELRSLAWTHNRRRVNLRYANGGEAEKIDVDCQKNKSNFNKTI